MIIQLTNAKNDNWVQNIPHCTCCIVVLVHSRAHKDHGTKLLAPSCCVQCAARRHIFLWEEKEKGCEILTGRLHVTVYWWRQTGWLVECGCAGAPPKAHRCHAQDDRTRAHCRRAQSTSCPVAAMEDWRLEQSIPNQDVRGWRNEGVAAPAAVRTWFYWAYVPIFLLRKP
jgi:hypothetical protein